MKRPVMLAGIGLVWGALIAFGTQVLLRYESSPGMPGTPPSRWPLVSILVRPSDKFTLVVLTHPDCPCTRASLAELETLMAQAQGKLVAFILFSKPGASAAEVRSSDLWKKAAIIPGVSTLYDNHGVATGQFGGHVSGQTMLYDPEGKLVFSGGLTSGRGRQGYSAGADAVLKKVNGGPRAPVSTPVFGCALHDPGALALKEDPLWEQ